MIPVCSVNQNNMENMRNKWYEIVGDAPGRLTNKLIIRGVRIVNEKPETHINTGFFGF